jgi:hypothetical protein
MPRRTWSSWLKALLDCITPQGFLIFTTHGEKSRQYLGYPQIDAQGFWFKSISEQKDLDTAEYGETITLPRFVFSELSKMPGVLPVFYREAFWWNHQDTYVLRVEA